MNISQKIKDGVIKTMGLKPCKNKDDLLALHRPKSPDIRSTCRDCGAKIKDIKAAWEKTVYANTPKKYGGDKID